MNISGANQPLRKNYMQTSIWTTGSTFKGAQEEWEEGFAKV